jgi:ABC-type enterochelin transport system permease subunit
VFKDRQTIGVFLAVAILAGIVLLATKATKSLIEKDKISFLFVLLVSLLAGVWVIDKVVAFKTHLLEPDETKFIETTMAAIIFSIMNRAKENKEPQK